MMFKTGIIAACAALSLASVADAGADFTFAAATDGTYFCSSYCVGFTSSDDTEVVTFANVQYGSPTVGYRVTLTIDGVTYQGYTPGSGAEFTALSADGSYALETVSWNSKTTCVRSGRGQHCTTWNYTTGGAILIP